MPAETPLLDWTPPPSDRFGESYTGKFDFDRLNGQQARVFDALKSMEGWLTLREIHELTGDPEASISARLRDLRRPEFGGMTIDKRRRGEETRGLWEYRLEPASIPKR